MMLGFLKDYFIRKDLESWQDDIIRRYHCEGVTTGLLEEQVLCNIQRVEYGLPVRFFFEDTDLK